MTWATVKVFGGSFGSTVAMYIFHMTYLGIGYLYTQSVDYDINWTMPGCVLCLRMIGLAADGKLLSYLRVQSFTSLMADLRQDINRLSSLISCLNGTFP